MSYTGPNLGLESGFVDNQDGWGEPYNDAMRRVDALTNIAVTGVVSSLPGSPTNGDRYLLSPSAETNPNYVAVRVQGAWDYYPPGVVRLVFVASLGFSVWWNGSAWVNATVPTHASRHAPGGADALPWGTIHGFGTLAARPAASSSLEGYTYLAIDVHDGTLFRCSYVESTWTWVQSAPGVSQVASSGTLLIPPTSGAPDDSPSISGGHPVRFDPATRRLYVFQGANWYKTQMVISVPGLGAIDGIVGWWVANDSAVGGGSNLPSLIGRIGPTLDAVGASEPTIAAAAVNGKKAINFGSGQNLRVPTNPFAGATAGELFYVLKSGVSTSGTSEWNGPKWTTSTEAAHYPYPGPTNYLNLLRNTRVNFGMGGVDIGSWHVLRAQSNSNYRYQLNGVTVYDAATGAFAVQSIPLITGGGGDLQVAAVIAFDTSAKAGGVLTTDEYNDVKAWIFSEFGIALP